MKPNPAARPSLSIICLETRDVHAVDAHKRQPGQVFGWKDETSPTGWLSGVIVKTGPHVVTVESIAPAVVWDRITR